MKSGDGLPFLSAKRGRPKGSKCEVQALEVPLPNRRRKDTAALPMPVKKARPPPGSRKAGRPKKGAAAAPSLAEAAAQPPPCPLPNLPSSSSSSTRPKVYLLGKLLHPTTPLGYAKLPKIGKVLQKAFGFKNIDCSVESRDAAAMVTDEVLLIWKHHFGVRVIEGKDFEGDRMDNKTAEQRKMVCSRKNIVSKVVGWMKEYTHLKEESKRPVKRACFARKEELFKEKLDLPLNIMKTGKFHQIKVGDTYESVLTPSGEEILSKSGILSWQEDLNHLHNQLSKEQPGTCEGYDVRQQNRDVRILKKKEAETQKRRKEDEWKEQRKKIHLEEEEGEEEKENDDNFVVAEQRRVKKVNIMSHISSTADRLNLSMRSRAMCVSSVTNALGVDLSATNISVMSAWRHGKKAREKVAQGLKEKFDPSRSYILHWDGKSVHLSRGAKGHFVAIYLTTADGSAEYHLLDIPNVQSSKAKDELEAIKAAFLDWRVRKESIIGIVFDTTSSNTGEWSGVCVLLREWIGAPLLWLACRKHMIGEQKLQPLLSLLNVWASHLLSRLSFRAPTQMVLHRSFWRNPRPWLC